MLVLESDGRITHRDFSSLEAAQQYAEDAASGADAASPLAYIFDSAFQIVDGGQHYATRGGGT